MGGIFATHAQEALHAFSTSMEETCANKELELLKGLASAVRIVGGLFDTNRIDASRLKYPDVTHSLLNLYTECSVVQGSGCYMRDAGVAISILSAQREKPRTSSRRLYRPASDGMGDSEILNVAR